MKFFHREASPQDTSEVAAMRGLTYTGVGSVSMFGGGIGVGAALAENSTPIGVAALILTGLGYAAVVRGMGLIQGNIDAQVSYPHPNMGQVSTDVNSLPTV